MIFSIFVLGLHGVEYSKTLFFSLNPNPFLLILHDILANTIVLLFLTFIVAFNLRQNIKKMFVKLGLDRTHSLSEMVPIIAFLHCIGMLINVLLFWYHDRWLFTLSNIWDPFVDGIDYHKVFYSLICCPIREEMVYRGLFYLLIYRHVNPANFTTTTNPNKPRSDTPTNNDLVAVKRASLISGFCFGGIHALNLLSTDYSVSYVTVQVVVGCIVSFYYTLRMVVTGSLWEPMVLHILNNTFSVFIDISTDDVTDPLVLLPIIFSMWIYSVLIYRSWNVDLIFAVFSTDIKRQ